MGLLGLLGAALSESVTVGLRATAAAARREEIRQQLSAALERLTRDMTVAENVDAAQDGRFQFDTPSDGNVDYVYDGTDDILSRDDANSPQVDLVSRLTSFDFDYFNGSGTQLSTPVAGASEDTIRVVQVTATVTYGSETVSVASAAYLRNM